MRERPFERIILHIGWPKTGTTSVQAALVDSQAMLVSQGICCPVLLENGKMPTCNHSQHLKFQLGLLGKGERERFAEENCASFAQAVQDMQCGVLLLSGEGMTFWTRDDWEAFLGWLKRHNLSAEATRFEVVVVTRDLVTWYRRLLDQRLIAAIQGQDEALSWAPELASFLIRCTESRLAAFGREACFALRFEDLVQTEDGPLSVLSQHLGVRLASSGHHENPSRSFETSRLLRALGPDWKNRQIFSELYSDLPGTRSDWTVAEAMTMADLWSKPAARLSELLGVEVTALAKGHFLLDHPALYPQEWLDAIFVRSQTSRHNCKRWPAQAILTAFNKILIEDGAEMTHAVNNRLMDFIQQHESLLRAEDQVWGGKAKS